MEHFTRSQTKFNGRIPDTLYEIVVYCRKLLANSLNSNRPNPVLWLFYLSTIQDFFIIVHSLFNNGEISQGPSHYYR